MTTPHRPEVFISATSADLRSCRQVIKEALLTLGCMPVEQTNFPPDFRTVRDMLRTKIAACDAVVHLAGVIYGAEPQAREPGEPRRSYTQLEYDLARELKKPLYVFVCGEDFAYDEHTPEDDEKRALQQAHRAALSSSETLRYKVGSRDELALKVRELQTRVETLGAELKKTRSWLGRGVAAGLATLVVLGMGLWWLNHRADQQEQTSRAQAQEAAKTQARVAQLETEVDKQRRYLKSVADAFTQQKSELDKLKIPEAEQFTRAIAKVAADNGIPAADLQASIDLFVAATKADPNADFMDRALSDFAEKNFAGAAKNAGEAARAAREQYLAADQLAAQLTAKSDEARRRARIAFYLQGQSLYALKSYRESVAAFELALEATPRAADPESWAELQFDLAISLLDWAKSSENSVANDLTTRATAILRSALEVFRPEKSRQHWAVIQTTLGMSLRDQARRAPASDALPLFTESATCIRSTLGAITPNEFPDVWALTQHELGLTLVFTAEAQARSDRLTAQHLLLDALQAFASEIEIPTKDDFPRHWLKGHEGVMIAAHRLSLISDGRDRLAAKRLFRDTAVKVHHSGLDAGNHTSRAKAIADVEAEIAVLEATPSSQP